MRIVVLGAGISGVATAYLLARNGCEVTVIDRAHGVADETSYANGGVVGGTQIEPWASPGLQWQILKWLGREDAPLLVRWREIPRIKDWGLRFLRNCTAARFKRNLAASGRLTRHSLRMFDRIRSESGIDPEEYRLIRKGAIKLYMSEESFTTARAEVSPIRELGFDVEAVDAAACVKREPGLAPVVESIAGGVVYREEEIGDCRLFTRALADRAAAEGVVFQFDTEVFSLDRAGDLVESVRTNHGHLKADIFVVATASYSAPLLQTCGLDVPVIPTKGVTISVPAAPWRDAVRSAVMDHSRLFGLIRIGDDLRVSGSAEIAGYDTVPNPARCDAIIANVLELFPDFHACLDAGKQRRWAGVRGNSPDGPPIIGSTPIANLYLNIGHGPQGWSTSCGCADLVAASVLGKTPAIDLDGLTIARFRTS